MTTSPRPPAPPPSGTAAVAAGILTFAALLAWASPASVAEESPAPDRSWTRTTAALDAQVRAKLDAYRARQTEAARAMTQELR